MRQNLSKVTSLKTLETTDLKAILTNYNPNQAISLHALVGYWAYLQGRDSACMISAIKNVNTINTCAEKK